MIRITEEKAQEHWMDTTHEDGIVRWDTNNKVPPNDIVEAFKEYGFITKDEAEATNLAHENELDYARLERYMKAIDEKMIFEAVM
jgi:hypothetical protein